MYIGGLHGVDVVGETKVVISNDELEYYWSEYGLKLQIPESSLPEDVKQCTINIKASLAGQYQFPDNSQLVSAVFWLRCEPMCKLAKPVTLEIEHCALSQNVSKLSFVKAVCTQKQLPYSFNRLGGQFTSLNSYGKIELKHFSGVAINQEGQTERSYFTCLLYKQVQGYSTRLIVEIYFVVVWNTLAHQNVSAMLF